MMKQWVVCYDYGPHMTTEVVVAARYADTARKRGIAAAQAKGHSPHINWVKLEQAVEQERKMNDSISVRKDLVDHLEGIRISLLHCAQIEQRLDHGPHLSEHYRDLILGIETIIAAERALLKQALLKRIQTLER